VSCKLESEKYVQKPVEGAIPPVDEAAVRRFQVRFPSMKIKVDRAGRRRSVV
tara:strand:+ start:1008 stop:1163 length:156 start_codon:yes stop_codon:yes gene_type:complete